MSCRQVHLQNTVFLQGLCPCLQFIFSVTIILITFQTEQIQWVPVEAFLFPCSLQLATGLLLGESCPSSCCCLPHLPALSPHRTIFLNQLDLQIPLSRVLPDALHHEGDKKQATASLLISPLFSVEASRPQVLLKSGRKLGIYLFWSEAKPLIPLSMLQC